MFLHCLSQGLQEQDQKKLRHAPGPHQSSTRTMALTRLALCHSTQHTVVEGLLFKTSFPMNPKPSLRQTGYGYQGLIVTELLAQRGRASSSLRSGGPCLPLLSALKFLLRFFRSRKGVFFIFLRSSYTNIGKIDKRVNMTWYMIIMEFQAAAKNNRKDLENRKRPAVQYV